MKRSVRISLWTASASVAAVSLLVVAFAVPPFRGIRPNEAGTITQANITFNSAANTWAKVFREDLTTVVRGTVRVPGTEWTHAYTQDNCPAGFTIVPGGVNVVERGWTPVPGLILFVEQGGNSGIPAGTVAHTSDEPLLSRQEIANIQFNARTPGVVFWQANRQSWPASLLSTEDIRAIGGSTWRKADSARTGFQNPPTVSQINICSRAVAGACGDGTVDAGEQCDDGNQIEGDGCNPACIIEGCGNGYYEPERGETCDDGNLNNGDGCNSMCQTEYCGDGIVQPTLGEKCDDGNGVSGDGCENDCTFTSSSSSSDSSSSYSSFSTSSFSSSYSSTSSLSAGYCGDLVCDPLTGENATTCPIDCAGASSSFGGSSSSSSSM